MKIVFYCQHVLGIGHFFRSLEICRALDRHQVILVTGGPRFDAGLPDHVRVSSAGAGDGSRLQGSARGGRG